MASVRLRGERKEMNYGRLVRRPFEIVARRPYLWLLGILAGGASSMSFNGGGGNRGYGPGRHAGGTYTGPTGQQIQAFWNQNWEWIAAIAIAILVVGLVLFVISCIATGSIVRAAVEHDDGRDYRLGTAWKAGFPTGWRVAGLKILTFLLAAVPALLVFSLFAAAVAGASSSMVGAAVGFGLSGAALGLVALAFWLFLSVAYQMAPRMVVLENAGVAESLSSGFRMIF